MPTDDATPCQGPYADDSLDGSRRAQPGKGWCLSSFRTMSMATASVSVCQERTIFVVFPCFPWSAV